METELKMSIKEADRYAVMKTATLFNCYKRLRASSGCQKAPLRKKSLSLSAQAVCPHPLT